MAETWKRTDDDCKAACPFIVLPKVREELLVAVAKLEAAIGMNVKDSAQVRGPAVVHNSGAEQTLHEELESILDAIRRISIVSDAATRLAQMIQG